MFLFILFIFKFYSYFTGMNIAQAVLIANQQRIDKMKWSKPEYNDIRFGFEVTMYINNK